MKSNIKYYKFSESCDECLKYSNRLDTSSGKIICEDCYNLLTDNGKYDIIDIVRKEDENERRSKKVN